MVDLDKLSQYFPICGLEPQQLAILDGFSASPQFNRQASGTIAFLEPPAGQRVPFVDAVRTLAVVFEHQGLSRSDAQEKAAVELGELRRLLPSLECVPAFDDLHSDTVESVPLPRLTDWLRSKKLADEDVVSFLERAGQVTSSTPLFSDREHRDHPISLANLPESPPPNSMIEFLPVLPWVGGDPDTESYRREYSAWSESLRPVLKKLEDMYGEAAYDFADPDDECDDDFGHRFLVLHWCCTFMPESAYVQFLIEASGATDVEDLKQALLDPANYTAPYTINGAWRNLESKILRFKYISPKTREYVCVAFSTAAARDFAERLIRERINVNLLILAPKQLVSHEWLDQVTANCWSCRIRDVRYENSPIEILASTGELHVISDAATTNSSGCFELQPVIEDLLWRAMSLNVPYHLYSVTGEELRNPNDQLLTLDIPQHLFDQDQARVENTERMTEIRVCCDHCFSGLLDSEAVMISYDDLEIPFPLIRRIAAWQRDYEANYDPPVLNASAAWHEEHEQEEIVICQELQAALGDKTEVKLLRGSTWISIADYLGGKSD